MVYFVQSLHIYACQHSLTTDMRYSFLMDKALPSIRQAGCGQLEQKLKTLDPNGIFRSNNAYLHVFNVTLLRHWYAK